MNIESWMWPAVLALAIVGVFCVLLWSVKKVQKQCDCPIVPDEQCICNNKIDVTGLSEDEIAATVANISLQDCMMNKNVRGITAEIYEDGGKRYLEWKRI